LWTAISPWTKAYGDGTLYDSRIEITWEDLIDHAPAKRLPFCIEDFFQYLDDLTVRMRILQRIVGALKGIFLLKRPVDIVAHSEGTIVAYEALRTFDAGRDANQASGPVTNFFTMGAALGFQYGPLLSQNVRNRLLMANEDGTKPTIAQNWWNLCATGDPFGSALMPAYAVTQDFVNLPAPGCGPTQWDCSHNAYFDSSNLPICRDIIAAKINAS
jgi:hypothetical protein